MPRKTYNIRWSESDNQELNRVVRNFNAKVSRLEKKYKDDATVVIPEKVRVRDMRKLIDTRRDLQVELRSMQAFSRKGSEKLVRAKTNDTIYITSWQKKELVKRSKRINEAREQRLEDLKSKKLVHEGKDLGYTKGQLGMGKSDTIALQPTSPFTRSMTKADIHKKMEHYRRESQSTYWNKRDVLMRDNFIKALENNFGKNRVNYIKHYINNMSIEEFKDILLADPQDFDVAYFQSQDELDETLNHITKMFKPKK